MSVCVWVLAGALFVAGCPDYSADHATLYNATSFPVRVRIWSAAHGCDDAAPSGEALSLSDCVELPADTAYPLPQVSDGDRCEFAIVQSAGLETTALAWDRDLVGGEGRGHPDVQSTLRSAQIFRKDPGSGWRREISERNLLTLTGMNPYRVATLLGASGFLLAGLVFGPSFGCGQRSGSACATDQDCRSDETCVNASCVALDCPASKPWVTDSQRGRVCSECQTTADCPEGLSCVDWDHRSDYTGASRCSPTNCRADSDCRLEEVCWQGLCISEADRCETQADCTSVQTCLRGRCERIRCPVEMPLVGYSPTGPFCEECQRDDDCPPTERCQALSRGEQRATEEPTHACVSVQ